MGARHSKRSVDITTTPRKGEEGAVIEGEEGKLEKVGEPDLNKITTNGTLHNEIEFADKEETSKDETEEKEKAEPKEEIKENGLPEEPSNAVNEKECPKAEGAGENASEQQNGEVEKTSENTEQKVEETTEQKKKKEKKKKWSFRSISFSKKDKTKPSKESNDKNGDVKEVAEENVEEKNASPATEETPKAEETKLAENSETSVPVTNGDSPSAETAASAEATEAKPAAEVSKPSEEPLKPAEPETGAQCEEAKPEQTKETEVEPASTPITEEASKTEEPSKEVRTEEVPPPLPSSNPPSPVTVFAESTKAEAALTSGHVPLEEPQEVQDITKSVVAEAVSSALPATDDSTVLEPSAVTELISVTKTSAEESQPPCPPVPEAVANINNQSLVEPAADEPLPPSPPTPEPINEKVVVSAQSSADQLFYSPPSSVPQMTQSSDELPPSPPSPVTESPKNDLEPQSRTLFNETKEEQLDPSPSIEELPPAPPSPIPDKIEISAEQFGSVSESSLIPADEPTAVPVSLIEDKGSEPNIESDITALKQESVIESLSIPANESILVSQDSQDNNEVPAVFLTENFQKTEHAENEAHPPAEPIFVSENIKTEYSSVEVPNVEPTAPPPTPATSTEITAHELPTNTNPTESNITLESITPVESLSATVSPPPQSDISEPVAPADSLPDISTESLPSLPEPVSESLAPMSLPPVDSVPDPIAPASEPELSSHEEVPPAPLTNGNMNGHSSPSPVEEAVLGVPGPTKQIASDVAKESEITPEAGDNPSETAVATAEE